MCLQFHASDQFSRALFAIKMWQGIPFCHSQRFQLEIVRQTRFVWDAFQRRLIQMKSGEVISSRDLKRQRVDGKARKRISLAPQIFLNRRGWISLEVLYELSHRRQFRSDGYQVP